MAANFTFDGPNRLFVMNTGVVSGGTAIIDVQVDLYSDWKEEMLLSDNAKWASALRSIGGDPTPLGLAGDTYFLINGFRIRPEEVNHTLDLQGNLFVELDNGNFEVESVDSETQITVKTLTNSFSGGSFFTYDVGGGKEIGSDGITSGGSGVFTSATATFVTNSVDVGDTLVISGGVADSPVLPTVGAFTVLVEKSRSNLIDVISTGVSGLTDSESTALLNIESDQTTIQGDISTIQGDVALLQVDMAFLKAIEEGEWNIEVANNQMVFYNAVSAEIKRFDLYDRNGNPTSENIFRRVPV